MIMHVSSVLLSFPMSVGFSFLMSHMMSLPSHHDCTLSSKLVLTPLNLENRTPAYKSATINVKVERGLGSQKKIQAPKGPCPGQGQIVDEVNYLSKAHDLSRIVGTQVPWLWVK